MRVGLLGDTGTGKTRAALALVSAYLRASAGYVLVADYKGEGRFSGQLYRDPGELAERPPAPEPRVLVFTGAPFEGRRCDPEEVARLAWRLAELRRPTLQVHDELASVSTGGQWCSGTTWIPQSFTMGRARRVSVLWGTQVPHDAPREALAQTDVILAFRIDAQAIDLLARRGFGRALDRGVVAALPGAESPPAERGQFVLLRREREWDGAIYRF